MTDTPAAKASVTGVLQVTALGLGTAALLALTHGLTSERILRNETAELRSALSLLLPEGATLPEPLPAPDDVPGAWPLCGDALLAQSSASGYAGPLRLLYTLRPAEGRLGRVELVAHQETPGITDFLNDAAWWAALEGQDAAALATLDAVTGATITSEAIGRHLSAVLREPAAALGPRVADDAPGCDP